jgi:hypothetical protein
MFQSHLDQNVEGATIFRIASRFGMWLELKGRHRFPALTSLRMPQETPATFDWIQARNNRRLPDSLYLNTRQTSSAPFRRNPTGNSQLRRCTRFPQPDSSRPVASRVLHGLALLRLHDQSVLQQTISSAECLISAKHGLMELGRLGSRRFERFPAGLCPLAAGERTTRCLRRYSRLRIASHPCRCL